MHVDTGKHHLLLLQTLVLFKPITAFLILFFHLEQVSAKYSPQVKPGPLPVFVHKIWLNTAMPFHFCIVQGCFLLLGQSRAVVTPPYGLPNPQMFTIWPFTERVCQPLVWRNDPVHVENYFFFNLYSKLCLTLSSWPKDSLEREKSSCIFFLPLCCLVVSSLSCPWPLSRQLLNHSMICLSLPMLNKWQCIYGKVCPYEKARHSVIIR